MHLSARARWALLLGDVLVLTAFVAEGMREHETIDAVFPLLDIGVTVLYYAPVWLAAAWLLGAYPRDASTGPSTSSGPGSARSAASGRELLSRTLNAWLVAAPLATIVRAYALGRVIIPVPFLVVTLGLPAVLLLAWRAAFVWFMHRRA